MVAVVTSDVKCAIGVRGTNSVRKPSKLARGPSLNTLVEGPGGSTTLAVVEQVRRDLATPRMLGLGKDAQQRRWNYVALVAECGNKDLLGKRHTREPAQHAVDRGRLDRRGDGHILGRCLGGRAGGRAR